MNLSIVTTLYNSEETISEFYERVTKVAEQITTEFEIVMVDDGSRDRSLEIASALAQKDRRVTVVELSRNFGHHKALMAGMQHSVGDLVFLIDVDLEETPELLTLFFDQLQSAAVDVVYGYQIRRKGGVFERIGGMAAWFLVRKLYNADIPLNQCTVRLMRRAYVNALLLHKESNTVIGGLWAITGFRQIGMAVDKGYRRKSSYSASHRIRTLLNGVTSFSEAPLFLMIYLGMLFTLVSFFVGVFVILEKVLFRAQVGWASLIVSIWFIGGVIVFCLGVIGVYVSRIFIETKQRPYIIVRRVIRKE